MLFEKKSEIESGGQIGKLLRNIMNHEDPVKTRQVDLEDGEELYAWLRDTADEVLAADPEWQTWEQSIEEGSMPQLVSTEIPPQYRDGGQSVR